MPEYLSPGVYVEEFEIGSKPIEGVSTSTAGFLGEAERGPTTARFVTSWLQYQRIFGSYFGADKYLPYAVQGFFDNGGQRCYIGRIARSDASPAFLGLNSKSKVVLNVEAIGKGESGNKVAVKVSQGSLAGFKLSVFYWKTMPSPLYDPEVDSKALPRPDVVENFDNISLEESSPDYCEKKVNGISNLIRISREPGVSKEDIPDVLYDAVLHQGMVQGSDVNSITLAQGASADDDFYSNMVVEIIMGKGINQRRTITDYSGNSKIAIVSEKWDVIPDFQSRYHVIACEDKQAQEGGAKDFTILAADASGTDGFYNGMLIEITEGTAKGEVRQIVSYEGTSKRADIDANRPWDDDAIPDSNSVYRIIAHEGLVRAGGVASITLGGDASDTSGAYNGLRVEVTAADGIVETKTIEAYDGTNKVAQVDSNWAKTPQTDSSYCIQLPFAFLKNGSNGNGDLELADYQGDISKVGGREGLAGFVEIDDISIVYAPNPKSIPGLVGALITHCETLKDRFAIIDAEDGQADIPNITPRNDHDTKYAAFYYPWIKVIDPPTGMKRLVPPGGHIAGIYARTDTERGVHKAPANEVVRGAVDLEFQITKGEHDVLNPKGVNVIRAFPGRGIRVWGARTLSSDPIWKYINVRRLFIFLEESIEEGTQWVVFEPNDTKLWARVRGTVTDFLTRVWRDGALFGRTPEEAFFVKCDETTMTQDDIDNGKLICIIGVAPVKPAEFVIFRIAQWSGGTEVTE